MATLALRLRALRKPPVIRWLLGALLGFGALNAFGGGYYGLAGAKGVPLSWLEGSVFADYSIPSLILFVAVGGSLLTAAIAVFARFPRARLLAVAAAVVLLVWIAVQLFIIGYVSWMQPTTLVAGFTILLLAGMLPDR
jgi:hypothetical protein